MTTRAASNCSGDAGAGADSGDSSGVLLYIFCCEKWCFLLVQGKIFVGK